MAALRQRRKDEKLAQIRASALELFRRKGYRAVTTREVAQAADVGTGTLFLYARDKDELVILAYDGVLAATVAELFATDPAEAGLLDRLTHLYGGIVDLVGRERENLGAYLRAMQFAKHSGGHIEQAVQRHRHLISTVAGWIEREQRAGTVDSTVDPALASRNFHALFAAALMESLGTNEDPATRRAALRASLGLQVRALGPERSR